jgi:hypothetical protein
MQLDARVRIDAQPVSVSTSTVMISARLNSRFFIPAHPEKLTSHLHHIQFLDKGPGKGIGAFQCGLVDLVRGIVNVMPE